MSPHTQHVPLPHSRVPAGHSLSAQCVPQALPQAPGPACSGPPCPHGQAQAFGPRQFSSSTWTLGHRTVPPPETLIPWGPRPETARRWPVEPDTETRLHRGSPRGKTTCSWRLADVLGKGRPLLRRWADAGGRAGQQPGQSGIEPRGMVSQCRGC